MVVGAKAVCVLDVEDIEVGTGTYLMMVEYLATMAARSAALAAERTCSSSDRMEASWLLAL